MNLSDEQRMEYLLARLQPGEPPAELRSTVLDRLREVKRQEARAEKQQLVDAAGPRRSVWLDAVLIAVTACALSGLLVSRKIQQRRVTELMGPRPAPARLIATIEMIACVTDEQTTRQIGEWLSQRLAAPRHDEAESTRVLPSAVAAVAIEKGNQ
ncbi:MAG: hypothetical protein R3E01_28225 [Pirellulaceae bacterium]|nr:hypothetical protein [Planctomycetales bacterium]